MRFTVEIKRAFLSQGCSRFSNDNRHKMGGEKNIVRKLQYDSGERRVTLTLLK